MKQEIEIPYLPVGYMAVAYRIPINGETCWHQNFGIYTATVSLTPCFIVEKIKPRRIVLEEISREEYYRVFNDEQCTEIYTLQGSHWKQVKEGDE